MMSKPVRAALLDFDGTLVREDITTLLAGLNGKQAESDALNSEFRSGRLKGVTGLIRRTNMLAGISLQQIEELLQTDDHLMPGAVELFDWFHAHDVLTILASGSMLPVLEHYKSLLSIDHIVGTHVAIEDNIVLGVDPDNPLVDGFKLTECIQLLTTHNIPIGDALAIGDSPADKGLLLHAGIGIAINPVGGIDKVADHVIYNDLTDVISILERTL